jgi:hypothetical protein
VGAGSTFNDRYTLTPVATFTIQPDGKLLVGGQFNLWNGVAAPGMVRLNANGSVDGGFSAPEFNHIPQTIIYQPSGAVVVGGFFASPAAYLTRLTPSGTVDSTWNPGGAPDGPVYAVSQDPAGSLFVGGNFFNYAGASSQPLVRVAGGGGDAYDLWMSTRFSAAQISAGQAVPGADADGDGDINLLEMAVGTSPTSSSSRPMANSVTTVFSGAQNHLQLEFTKGPGAAGLWIGAQFSSNLQAWSPASPTPGSNATCTVIEDSECSYQHNSLIVCVNLRPSAVPFSSLGSSVHTCLIDERNRTFTMELFTLSIHDEQVRMGSRTFLPCSMTP